MQGDRRAPAAASDAGDARGPLTRADLPAPLLAALDAAIDKGAKSPAILQVTEIAGYTDYVLIVSARNERQVAAVADAIDDAGSRAGGRMLAIESSGDHVWDLLDFDDFMVHVFFHPVRTHYDLESMWSDAPRVALGLPPDVMETGDLEQLALPTNLPAYRGDSVFGGFDDEFGDVQPAPARTRGRRPAPGDSVAAGRLARARTLAAPPADDSTLEGEAPNDDDADDFGDDDDLDADLDADLGDDDDLDDDGDDDLDGELAGDDAGDSSTAKPTPAKPRTKA